MVARKADRSNAVTNASVEGATGTPARFGRRWGDGREADRDLSDLRALRKRIGAHFQRLAEETRSILPWTMGFNPGRGADLEIGVPYAPAATAMPLCWQAMVDNGGVRGGLMGVAIFSSLLAIEADQIWVVEYDVDCAGTGRIFLRSSRTTPRIC